jgi:hypothetical protein
MPPTKLFVDIAREWSGWKGEKKWGALEGEYNLSATCDSLGHITLKVGMMPNAYPPVWSAIVSLVIEAGQLDKLAREVETFFNVKD